MQVSHTLNIVGVFLRGVANGHFQGDLFKVLSSIFTARLGHKEVVKVLLYYGANTEIEKTFTWYVNPEGTALDIAGKC